MRRLFDFPGAFALFSLPLISLAWLPLSGAASAEPGFKELLHNPRWYRTFDTSSSIIPDQGTLLYAWRFADAERHPDSFFVGIDTLWSLPQDVQGDTAWDWDLQVCPDEICMNGLKAGIHGANAPYPFGDTGFESEHHFQFFPAVDSGFNFISPPGSLFGAMMYCRSRTTEAADTVFAFGAWGLEWDSASPPPVRPMEGYLPRRSDFIVTGNKVAYAKGGSAIHPGTGPRKTENPRLTVARGSEGIRFLFPGIGSDKEVSVFAPDGRLLWTSGRLAEGQEECGWNGAADRGGALGPGIAMVRLRWWGGQAWAAFAAIRF